MKNKGEMKMGSQCSKEIKETRICPDAQKKVRKELSLAPKRAILACEGGCIKGEVARVAANILAYRLERDSSVRICLGDAATGNSGMIKLVKRAPEVIAVEGCPLQCGTEIVKRRYPELQTTIVDASTLYEFDRNLFFEIFDLPYSEIEQFALTVAKNIQQNYFSIESKACAGLSKGCKD